VLATPLDRLLATATASLRPVLGVAAALVLAAPVARAQDAAPAPAGAPENCAGCHDGVVKRKVVHAAMQKTSCQTCHKAVPARVGKCKSSAASAWTLAKAQGDLCRACHEEKDLSSKFKVKHDFKGKCAECHDAHSSDLPKLMRASGRKLCLPCHDSRSGRKDVAGKIDLTRKVVHAALEKKECQECHDGGHGGAVQKLLKRAQPELCYGCHKRQDQYKNTHTAVRQGECLECHDAHSSSYAHLNKKPREEICLSCHEVEPLTTKSVKHAPVSEGRCLECHDAHGGERPAFVTGTGKALCLKCHDQKAPGGKGSAGQAMRVDLSRKFVHAAVTKGECTDCHDPGHSGDQLKLLKKAPLDLCYGCHTRKDTQKFVHSAVRLGDCSVCHAAHASDQKALLVKTTTKEMCFSCHQDDITGRAVVHRPVGDGKCEECHAPHGAPNRFVLTKGEGKVGCQACHKPVDTGKVRHAALDRYGCASCHDPHASGNRFLLGKKTNDLCVSCHAAQGDGRHVTPMVPGGHVVAGATDPRRPEHPFTCASCHNPHGSDAPRFFYYGATTMESCDGCHGDKSGRNPAIRNVVQRGSVTGAGSPGSPGSPGAPPKEPPAPPRPGGGSGEAVVGVGWTLWPEVALQYGLSTQRPLRKNWIWPPEKPIAPARAPTSAARTAPAEGR